MAERGPQLILAEHALEVAPTERLAQELKLPAKLVITAYEDVPRLLETEANLPVNADPLQADLANPD